MIPRHPKWQGAQPPRLQLHPLIPGHLAESVDGPEKARVGGSTRSLGHHLFNHFRDFKTQSRSITFQKTKPKSKPAGVRLKQTQQHKASIGFGRGEYSGFMNDSAISGRALRLHELIESSVAFRLAAR
jgi:hypothetical protein